VYEVIDVIVEQEVAGLAGVVFAGHLARPRRKLVYFVKQQFGSRHKNII
jgi:hypothetical protein